jgi:hypothetical protein
MAEDHRVIVLRVLDIADVFHVLIDPPDLIAGIDIDIRRSVRVNGNFAVHEFVYGYLPQCQQQQEMQVPSDDKRDEPAFFVQCFEVFHAASSPQAARGDNVKVLQF